MAKYEDYVVPNADGIDEQITDAAKQQEARQRDPETGQFISDPAATPNVDWEQRYTELEKLNSRQAQTLGEYRHTIDEFISGPTPAITPEPLPSPSPITVDELYEDPNAAVAKAVDNHPVVQEARALREQLETDQRNKSAKEFQGKHPKFQELVVTPEFQNWVVEDETRKDLMRRAHQYDFSAADALFTLYEMEKGLTQVRAQQDIQQAELVSSSGEMVKEPPRYSRQEYINKLKRARQGDLECDEWVKANAANYRMALQSGNVRD